MYVLEAETSASFLTQPLYLPYACTCVRHNLAAELAKYARSAEAAARLAGK